MDAFTVAAQMLGGLELGSGQLVQLRAVNSRYFQRLFTLLRAPETPAGPRGSHAGPDTPGVAREPTPAELAELRAMLVSDIRGPALARAARPARPVDHAAPAAEDPMLAWEWEGGRLC